jgi:hypothetical protein
MIDEKGRNDAQPILWFTHFDRRFCIAATTFLNLTIGEARATPSDADQARFSA